MIHEGLHDDCELGAPHEHPGGFGGYGGPYTVFVVLENDLGERRWWVLDHHDLIEDAWEHATEVGAQEYARTGIEPVLLDE